MEHQNTPHEFDAHRDTYSSDIEKSVSFTGQSLDFFTKVKADLLVKIIEREFAGTDAPLKMLDVGCGHGLIHPFLKQQASIDLDLTGIDVAASVIDVARENNPDVTYDTYDGLKLPYEDNSFSVAYAVCVMHHIPPAQWEAFMQEMKRVVKPGGLVAIFEHNPFNPLTSYIVKTCPLDENAVLLRSGRMKGFFEGAGLKYIERKFILFTPLAHKIFRAFDNCLGWLPLGAQYYVLGRVP